MIRRIACFDKRDWAHIFWLIRQMAIGFWRGDAMQIIDAWFWIKTHIKYDSERWGEK